VVLGACVADTPAAFAAAVVLPRTRRWLRRVSVMRW
jgi:hypothetical protein